MWKTLSRITVRKERTTDNVVLGCVHKMLQSGELSALHNRCEVGVKAALSVLVRANGCRRLPESKKGV